MQIAVRHGDVLVYRLPEKAKKAKGATKLTHNMLAEGEVTGHHHKVEPFDKAKSYLWIEKTQNVKTPHMIPGEELLAKLGNPEVVFSKDATAPVLFQAPDGTISFHSEVTLALTHQEHGTVLLAPGKYGSKVQREYSPAGIVRVVD